MHALVETRTLIVSPHVDDEVLGCFAFLRPNTYVLYMGVEERPGIPRQQRLSELEQSSSNLGFKWEILDFEVNHYSAPDLIAPIEQVINRIKPNTVLIPEPSYNQDHRAVYEAAVIATRPHDTNWMVSTVLVFEQPHSVMWSIGEVTEPNLFIEIDIEAKLAAYRLYASQVRGHRSPEILISLSGLRGGQIQRAYAEGYRVKRMII